MKFERKKLVIALAQVVGAAAWVAMGSASAQTTPAPGSPALVGAGVTGSMKLDVIGSGIKRSLEDQSLPVQVITADDIARSGVQNMEQLMRNIAATATAGATVGATMAGSSTYGQASASLRGLGSTRTLVLLDGQRMTPFAQEFQNGVDINAIPISAIERVEVLTDGASSIYGSDAVAGVINFVLKRNFTGATVGYEYSAPTKSGGGKTNNVWASLGYGDLTKDKFNATASFQWKKEDSLLASDRSFANSGNVPPYLANAATPSGRIEGIWIPGTQSNPRNATTNPYGITTGGYGNPGADSPGCKAMGMFAITNKPTLGTGTNCNFDSAPFVELFPQVETTSGVFTANVQFTPQAQGYFTGMYTQNKVNNTIQANPARFAFFSTDALFAQTNQDPALLIYPTNPNYPHAWLQSHGLAAMDGSVLAVTSRAFAAGGRMEYDKNTQQQYVAGVKGTWLKDWDYDIDVQWSKSQSDGSLSGGYFSQLAYANAWNTIGNTAGSYVDPWSVAGAQNDKLTAALKAANYIGPTATAEEKLSSFTAKTSGNLWNLPAGPVAASFGFSYMKQDYNIVVPEILGSGDISGLGGAVSNQSGDRNVTSGWVEFAVPVTKDFNLNLSGRVDHYNDLVDQNTPITGKVSATWQPWKWGMFRGSIGNGFRAPTLGELHKPVNIGTSEQFQDPLFADQGQIQVNAFNGGNLNLVPEKSNQGSVGFVLTPDPSFTGRIDWWKIIIKEYITTPLALPMINAARAGGYLYTPNEVTFLPDGEVDTVNEQLQNAGKATFSGIDFGANWRLPPSWAGNFTVDYNGTYYIKADLATASGVERNIATIIDPDTQNGLSISGTGGVIVRYKQNVSLNWMYGPWGATLTNNYVSTYQTNVNQVNGVAHSVPSFATWDLQGTYGGFKNVMLTVGARNLFDYKPHLFIPVSNQFQYGYDVSQYDPRGLTLYGRIVVSFN